MPASLVAAHDNSRKDLVYCLQTLSMVILSSIKFKIHQNNGFSITRCYFEPSGISVVVTFEYKCMNFSLIKRNHLKFGACSCFAMFIGTIRIDPFGTTCSYVPAYIRLSWKLTYSIVFILSTSN